MPLLMPLRSQNVVTRNGSALFPRRASDRVRRKMKRVHAGADRFQSRGEVAQGREGAEKSMASCVGMSRVAP